MPLLDLRAHPGENDKIRPNKNYRVDPAETNAYIVYSDVVVEPPAGMLYEVLDRAAPEDSAHMALTMPLPGTQRVLFRAEDGGVAPALWRAAAMEGVEGAVELSREESGVLPGRGAETRLPGFAGEETCVLLAAPGALRCWRRPRSRRRAVVPAAHGGGCQPEDRARSRGEEAAAARPATGARRGAREREKPRLNARAQAMALQTGLNPRRSRSLQEIIDDKWRRSRIDQLGHPVPGEATGMPVESPVEHAVDALRAAWRIDGDAARRWPRPSASWRSWRRHAQGVRAREDEARTHRLNEIEAQRLRLLNEVSALEARRADARERLLEDVRRENARKLAESERRLEAARRSTSPPAKSGRRARAPALAEAEKAPTRRRKSAWPPGLMESKALRFLQLARRATCPRTAALPSAGGLISDVRARLARCRRDRWRTIRRGRRFRPWR